MRGEQKSSSRSVSWESFPCVLYENVSLNHSSIRVGLRTIKHPHPPSGQDQGSVPSSLDELFTKCQPVRVSLKAVLNGRPHPTSHHTLGNRRHGVCGSRSQETLQDNAVLYRLNTRSIRRGRCDQACRPDWSTSSKSFTPHLFSHSFEGETSIETTMSGSWRHAVDR